MCVYVKMFIYSLWHSVIVYRNTYHPTVILHKLLLYNTSAIVCVVLYTCRPLRHRSFKYSTTHILGKPQRIETALRRQAARLGYMYKITFDTEAVLPQTHTVERVFASAVLFSNDPCIVGKF